MRDLGIMFVLPLLLYAAIRKPFIGLGLWLWTSAFNINQIVYGFAMNIPFNKLFAGVTIVSFLFSKEKSAFKLEGLSLLVILFFIIATISNLVGIGNEVVAWARWTLFAKIILFYFFAVCIMQKKIHFELLIWMLVISIGALSATEGVKFLVSGGAHRIGELRGISGDNNFFGVMIVTVIPLACYIFTQVEHKTLRLGVLGVIFFMILGIFSTFSRGAFLGLSVFAFSFWKGSNNKVLWLIVLVIIALGIVNLMPDTWLNRMDSVENADEDSSFMGRVIAWKIAILIAMDNFFGGGFRAVENMNVWYQYSLEFSKVDFITSPDAPPYFKATHSAYFQVLSNHGFIGLFIYLLMLLTAYIKLIIIELRAIKNQLESWIIMLSKMLKLALVSFSFSSAAVNLAYFDFLYAIFAMVVALSTIVAQQIKLKSL